MISPKKIYYNGLFSHMFPFTLITDLAFDSDQGEVSSYLQREVVASESYHGEFKRVNSYKYTESLAPKLTFIKEGFTDFSLDEVRQVLTWLTSKKTASFLDVYDDIKSGTIAYSMLGGFTDIQLYKLGNNRTVAIVAIFESVSPYAFSRLEAREINGANLTKYEKEDILTGTKIQVPMYIQYIDVSTDEPERAIYPRITIKQNKSVIVPVDHVMISGNKWIDGEDWLDGVVYYYDATKMYYYQRHYTTQDANGNTIAVSEPTATPTNPVTDTTKTGVIIKNTYVDQNEDTKVATLKIANNSSDEIVILDGANRVVSSWHIGMDLTTGKDGVMIQNSRVFGDSFNWSWLPLYNGINQIEVIGNCTVEIQYREVRKIGEY